MLLENLRIALRAIGANKMRSILTVLGVMIGVAAVIAVVSVVQGMQYKITNDLQDIGSSFIQVFPTVKDEGGLDARRADLTVDDAEAVRRGTTAIRDFTPLFRSNAELKYRDSRHNTLMYAVSPSYQDVVNHWVDHGRFFTPLDDMAKSRVVVVGQDVVDELRLGASPLGKVIQVDNVAFTVVGVMEKKGGSFGQSQDDLIIMPFSAARVIYGAENMKRLVLAFQMRPNADMDLAREQVREILRSRHRLKKDEKDDFRILAQDEIMKTISSVLMSVTMTMAAIVGIALLVGGIGIMNIMLVSVTERTREIGIRKSMGARRNDVLAQFLIEAIVLSGIGGGVGVAGGYLLAQMARFGMKRFVELPPVHTPFWAVALAFSFCAFLGIIFGIYPAAKASKLDPIDALRYE